MIFYNILEQLHHAIVAVVRKWEKEKAFSLIILENTSNTVIAMRSMMNT
jgi:hypothetical protein